MRNSGASSRWRRGCWRVRWAWLRADIARRTRRRPQRLRRNASADKPASKMTLVLPTKLLNRRRPRRRPADLTARKRTSTWPQIVGYGPRPPASEGIRHVQDYLREQLKSYGCTVDEDDFHASTPVGDVAMKNIVAKTPGTGQGIILLLTHYDSLSSVKNFVGAEDSASSDGVMLEMARLLCGKKRAEFGVDSVSGWRRSVC